MQNWITNQMSKKAPNYWIEKALHEKAKRELAELDLKLKQDQLVEVVQLASVRSDNIGAWCGISVGKINFATFDLLVSR